MDPTIAGALIGGGAALVGFGASAWQNRAILRANHEAARNQRLWEKRSALYEAALEITGRLESKDSIDGVQEAQRAITDWNLRYPQMTAYASDLVLRLYLELLNDGKAVMETGTRVLTGSESADALDAPLARVTEDFAFLEECMRAELQEGLVRPGLVSQTVERIHRAIARKRFSKVWRSWRPLSSAASRRRVCRG